MCFLDKLALTRIPDLLKGFLFSFPRPPTPSSFRLDQLVTGATPNLEKPMVQGGPMRTDKSKRPDLVAGTVVLVVAIFLLWEASRLPMGRVDSPQAGFVPFWESALLALLGLALVASSFRRGPGTKPDWPSGEARWMVLCLLGALGGYVFLVQWLGYVVSTFLFMCVAGSAWRHYPRHKVGIWAAGFAILMFVVFSFLLQVPLPQSALGLP